MAALEQLARMFGRERAPLQAKAPEPQLRAEPKPMTGFFSSLTKEQQAAALAYKGCDSFGDNTFPRRQAKG